MTAHLGWRLLCSRPVNGGTVVAIATLEIRATVGGPDQCSGGTVLFTSQFDANVGAPGFAAVNAFDGNAASAWASAVSVFGTVDAIGYGFAAPVTARQLAVGIRNTTPEWGQAPQSMVLQYTDVVGFASGWTDYVDFTKQGVLWNAAGQVRLFSGFHDTEAAVGSIRTDVAYAAKDDAATVGTLRTDVLTSSAGIGDDRIGLGTLRTDIAVGGRGDDVGVSIGSLRTDILYRPFKIQGPQLF